eukprot:6178844-Pleurochrysis_carterae.AAC.2
MTCSSDHVLTCSPAPPHREPPSLSHMHSHTLPRAPSHAAAHLARDHWRQRSPSSRREHVQLRTAKRAPETGHAPESWSEDEDAKLPNTRARLRAAKPELASAPPNLSVKGLRTTALRQKLSTRSRVSSDCQHSPLKTGQGEHA